MVLSGLRGVGKTVLLNALRSMAVRAALGHRQDRGPSRPVAAPAAVGRAARAPSATSPTATATPTGSTRSPACSRRSRCAPARRTRKLRDRWQPADRRPGRSGPGRLRRPRDRPRRAVHRRRRAGRRPRAAASRSSSTRCRTSRPTTSRRCARPAMSISQRGPPLVVVGAGLPHLPAVLVGVEVLRRAALPLRRARPARRDDADLRPPAPPPSARTSTYDRGRLDELYAATDGYPYFVQAYGKVTWDVAVALPDHRGRRAGAAPEAEAELAVGFFGSRYERATPAERDYMRAMADARRDGRDEPIGDRRACARAHLRPQAAVAVARPRRPDQEGPRLLRRTRQVAFTVPHFGKFLLAQA